MKQVVGAPFSGLLDEKLEHQIVRDLVMASGQKFDDPSLDCSQQRKILDQALEGLIVQLQRLLGARAQTYLSSIADQLLDIRTELFWNPFKNNCQTFCNSLIKTNIFGPLVNGFGDSVGTDTNHLYLMSFVCPQEGYVKPQVRTKFDVPSGLTEEYLLKFRYGRHDEADIIDTLQEYWHDWGAFGNTLYPYQDLFPWDCTEAHGRYPALCGDCNLAKHVWAFPFDSWSIISLHLTRDRYMYPPKDPEHPQHLSNEDWMRTRLTLLLAQDSLTTAAAAMARNPGFCKATRWLHEQKGDDRSLSRLKLGGIHRAQPFSHYFEQGTYQHYFIAEWAHLKRDDQIKAYELLRDRRARQPDVVYRDGRFGGSEVKSGFGGFGGSDNYSSAFAEAGAGLAAEGSHTDAGFGDAGDDGDNEVEGAGTCGDFDGHGGDGGGGYGGDGYGGGFDGGGYDGGGYDGGGDGGGWDF